MDGRDSRRRRDDPRDHRRHDRDRSRSPYQGRRDGGRRDRSPRKDGPPRGGPANRTDRDHDNHRRRDLQIPAASTSSRKEGERPPPMSRQAVDGRSNPAMSRGLPGAEQANVPDMSRADKPIKDEDEDEDEEAAMQRMLGFKSFRSTKNTKVPGNDKNHGVNKVKKVEYRQYMNRVGGFNRPLSPSRV